MHSHTHQPCKYTYGRVEMAKKSVIFVNKEVCVMVHMEGLVRDCNRFAVNGLVVAVNGIVRFLGHHSTACTPEFLVGSATMRREGEQEWH